MAHKTSSGTWRVRWFDGRWLSKNFEKKGDADAYEFGLKAGTIVVPNKSSASFGDFAMRWHRDHCLVQKAETQWKEDLRTIKNHLAPNLGKRKLDDIRLRDGVTLQGRLQRDGKLSPKSINLICGLARKILEDAAAWEEITSNPFRHLKPLRIPEQEITFWTMEERDRFIAHCRTSDPALAEFVTVALHTGMRLGELEGLKRDCIDFSNRQIAVRRNYNAKIKCLLESTKSKRIRRVPMNGQVMDIMVSRKLMMGDQFVFEGLSFHNIRKRFTKMCQRAGVKAIRIHDLRHTFASHLAMAGVPIFLIKELLGHADIKMTMRYAHLAPDALQGTTDVLSKVVHSTQALSRNESSLKQFSPALFVPFQQSGS